MTKDDLKRLFERNPSLSNANPNLGQILASKPQQRAPDALDPVAQGEEQSKARPVVRFTFYRVRLVDTDARAHGAKDLLDGLAEAGLIPGDREDQIEFDARQVKVSSRKQEGTEIEIEL